MLFKILHEVNVVEKPVSRNILTQISLLGLLAGPSGIRAGWVIETKSRLGAE